MNDLESLKKTVWPEGGETADRLFLRPLSIRITRVLLTTNIEPAQITLLSFILLVIGVFLFPIGNYFLTLGGMLLVYLSDVFDCVDGEIARARKRETNTGALLDYFVDRFGDILVYLSLTFSLFNLTGNYIALFSGLFAIIANLFMTDVGQKVDRLKQKSAIHSGRGARAYFNYGGSANTLILVAAAFADRVEIGLISIGVICFCYAFARFIEAYHTFKTERAI